MPESRWAHVLSFELGWMNPGQARAFVERARKAGLLEPDGEALRLRVDPAEVEVPRGFKPDPEAMPEAVTPAPGGPSGPNAASAPDLFTAWLLRVAEATGRTREHVLGEVAARQERLGGLLAADAALLWIAADAGLDVREAATEALSGLAVKGSTRAAAPAPGREARP